MDISRNRAPQTATGQVETRRGQGATSAISERQAQAIAALLTLLVFFAIGYGVNTLFAALGQ